MGKAYNGDEPLTIIFYTANVLERTRPRFARAVRDQLLSCAYPLKYPILCVSHDPLEFGDRNIVVGPCERSHLRLYKNILVGAQAAETEFVALAEDDALYPPSHFTTHRPPPHKFAYDFNGWGLNSWIDPPVFGYRSRAVINRLIAPRQLLVDALSERFDKYPDYEAMVKKFGSANPLKFWGDLGRYEKHLGVTVREWEPFAAPDPSVIFSHEEAFGFLSAGKRKSIGEGHRTELPYWGSAKSVAELWLEGQTASGF